jgi:hypothetical protein
MKALLLFHLRVGIRVAVRSFTPLFAGLLVVITLQMYPAAMVTAMARRLFAVHPGFEDILPVILLAVSPSEWLLLPALGLLVAADFMAGPVRVLRRRKPWRSARRALAERWPFWCSFPDWRDGWQYAVRPGLWRGR